MLVPVDPFAYSSDTLLKYYAALNIDVHKDG